MAVPKHKPFYYRLHSGHITVHVSRAELKALHKKIAKVLAQRGRGHRSYYVGLAFKGRCFHRLTITHHSAHKRHATHKAELEKPWVML